MTGVPIEPNMGEREVLGRTVVDFLNDFVEDRGTSPASWDAAPDLPEAFSAGPPEVGRDIEALLKVVQLATETGFDSAGPGFLSYIPSGGLYSAALGTFVASAINRYTGTPAQVTRARGSPRSSNRWSIGWWSYSGFRPGPEASCSPADRSPT